MQNWKKNIFIDAIKIRMTNDERSTEEILNEYTKLTQSEKDEILKAINI